MLKRLRSKRFFIESIFLPEDHVFFFEKDIYFTQISKYSYQITFKPKLWLSGFAGSSFILFRYLIYVGFPDYRMNVSTLIVVFLIHMPQYCRTFQLPWDKKYCSPACKYIHFTYLYNHALYSIIV